MLFVNYYDQFCLNKILSVHFIKEFNIVRIELFSVTQTKLTHKIMRSASSQYTSTISKLILRQLTFNKS